MEYEVQALMMGQEKFNGTLNFVPRVGEELQIDGWMYIVKNVRYIVRTGIHAGSRIQVILDWKK